MKRIATLTLLLMLAFGLGATTLIIGENNGYIGFLPVEVRYFYNYTQQIYRQSMIQHAGEITKIAFYKSYGLPESLDYSHDWVISIGHTDRDYFAYYYGPGHDPNFNPVSSFVSPDSLTQVFAGSVLSYYPQGNGEWMEIPLDTPFIYNNIDNLVVAVHENTPNPGWSNNQVYWGGHRTDDHYYEAAYFHSTSADVDINNLPEANEADSKAAIQLIFTDTEAPVAPALTHPADNGFARYGEALKWKLPYGSPDVTGYDVYIDGVMVSENQPGNQYVLGDMQMGTHTWQVIARNQLGNSPSASRSFVYAPGVVIGNGEEQAMLPLSPYCHYNYTQSIFLQADIDASNQGTQSLPLLIDSISYYFNGADSLYCSNDWAIYMGHTERTEFTNTMDWTPTHAMEQVFAGRLTIPAVPGWLTIELDTPFVYNNIDNLVIAVDENTRWPDYDFPGTGPKYFHATATPGQNRSIGHFSDDNNDNPDPNSPPIGYLIAAFPNLCLQFGDLPTVPIMSVSPDTLDFGLVYHGVSSAPRYVLISNLGGGNIDLNTGDVTVIGLNASDFSFDATLLPTYLGPGQVLRLPVSVSSVIVGERTATLRIVYAGQNYDVELIAEVLTPGSVIIGDGILTQAFPFSTDHGYMRSATLYTADQIGAAGFIDMLAWDCAATSDYVIPYKIWIKNTNDTAMSITRWQYLTADMTLVHEGNYVPENLGWNSFQLDVPFTYTGGNLIVGVEANYGSGTLPGQLYRYTAIDEQRHQYWFNFDSPPTGTGQLNNRMPNLMLHVNSHQAGDLAALGIDGNRTPTAGEATTFNVMIKNNDAETQTNYTVKLMGADNVELANVAGPPINSLQTLAVPITWTPTTAGNFTIYGKVERTGDPIAGNNQTEPLQLNVLPAGEHAITIGAGDQVSGYPMNFYYKNSLHQSMYLEAELGFGSGIITSLSLYNQFNRNMFSKPTKLYLASTDLEDLSAGWFPTSEMTLVYDGLVTYPSGENTINITFQIPYVYTGGNLVVMFYRPSDTEYYYSSNYFRSQAGSINRARYFAHNQDIIDPLNPPEGTVSNHFPQATFFYDPQAFENDLAALSISGADTATVGCVSNYTVSIKNNGTAAQDNYSVKIMGTGDVELASIAGPPIANLQTLDVAVPWTPTASGYTLIYGKVVLDGDEVAQNNQTLPIQVFVHPDSLQTVTIGAGDVFARYPMDFSFDSSLYQAIYTHTELGFLSGTITSLSVYNQFVQDRPYGATKIYLGHTGQQDLSTGFIPATELTLVYDGIIEYPIGENTITIHLQIPYEHALGNLVMMWYRPWILPEDHYSMSNVFKCQEVDGLRGHFNFGWNSGLDPDFPETGFATYTLPKVTFYYTAEPVGNDLGVMTISGNEHPTVGVVSNYTVRVKNNGSQTQSNYAVMIVGPGDAVLASLDGPPIESMQSLEVEIPWTPSTAGNYNIYGKVEMLDDEYDINNRTANLNLWVNPAGVHAVTIGDGNQYAILPIDISKVNSLFQTLYYPDEIGGTIGFINGLKLYSRFGDNPQNIPISIWLGTTTAADLSGGWIPATQLTPVFNGQVSFASGFQTVNIPFREPYLYLGTANLVMMIYKHSPQIYNSFDYFRCQTLDDNRCLYVRSDTVYDPMSPPGNTSPTAQFPKTTLTVEVVDVGQISGSVTGENNQPLAGVRVSIDNGLHTTTTNDAGIYELANVVVSTEPQTISFDLYGYYVHTQGFELENGEQLTINASLQPLPQVNLSGTILASDTQAGIGGALIKLSGYGSHQVNTDAAGVFTIAGVFGDATYNYNISAPGYASVNGQLTLPVSSHDMGVITLSEIAYAPLSVAAAQNAEGYIVDVTWLAPDPSALEIVESFEDTIFPPEHWSQTISNHGQANALGVYPTWCRVGNLYIAGNYITPTNGSFQAGVYWNYNHQDEWLITPTFTCPENAWLSFDSYVYLGSINGDHYYVKVSTDDGDTWTVLWDASAQIGGWNAYDAPITLDLSAYSGNHIQVAFHALGQNDSQGFCYSWYIDNICVADGNDTLLFDLGEMTTLSAQSAAPPAALLLRDPGESSTATRALTGYMVYRLQANQEHNEAVWTALTPEAIPELSVSDLYWGSLPDGNYRWAVKALYTGGVTSLPSFSNILYNNIPIGTIVGTVKNKDHTAIAGATVAAGTLTAITGTSGAYALVVPVGTYTVTASATGFESQSVEEVVVNLNESTTLNFVLKQTSADDPQIPVVATALNGNYPNPFNPETTISYSVREPGRVRLDIYNIKGQLVRTLVDEELATGHYKLVYNAKDNRGRSTASGVYLIRMSAPGYHKSSKMILMQ